MRRTIVLNLIALLAVGGAMSAAKDACAQHRGGHGSGSARGGNGFNRPRYFSPLGSGYGYATYASNALYDDSPQPVYLVQPPVVVQAPAPPVVRADWHPVVTEYTWPAAKLSPAPSTGSEPESQTLAIVLKNGSTLAAVSVFATDDGLHYVDPDARHMHISMSDVDRAATLKVNRARNLDLYLPAAQ
jgi:hypothetical protein